LFSLGAGHLFVVVGPGEVVRAIESAASAPRAGAAEAAD
jgi:hypothetical protein